MREPSPSLLVIGLRNTHYLGKALGENWLPFTLSIPFTSLSYLSLPLYVSPSTFLSLSLLLSLFSLSFSLAYLMDVFVLVYNKIKHTLLVKSISITFISDVIIDLQYCNKFAKSLYIFFITKVISFLKSSEHFLMKNKKL